MSFKENLLKKIEIDSLATRVLKSIGPSGSEQKIDRVAMKRLLEISPFRHQRERDLDLFIQDLDSGSGKILVLDNELPIYDTTIEDVAMRKSPTIKEMVNIRNAIKILKDSDVKISRKEDSVKNIQQECIAGLDLSFTESDIADIEGEGVASIKRGYSDGVIECLTMFAELLGYRPPPPAFKIRHNHIRGALIEKEGGEVDYGPMVVYSIMHNTIKLIDQPLNSYDRVKLDYFNKIVSGEEAASREGEAVFAFLKEAVMRTRG